ncbi:MAG: methyltransferase domain-containing protein [Rhodobacteraceae bacterium]|nr:methyltransferase domain-containing protein [Paracoccaceae bacterium]
MGLRRAVLQGGQTLAEARADTGTGFAALDPPGQARALRLALATLRHLDRADAVLAPFLRKPPPAPVRAILRLAVTERMVFDAPAHGVVNAAVVLARASRKGAALAGLVNAVLRKAVATPRAAWDALPPQRLPGWLRAPLVAAWGPEAVAAMEAAHMRGAALDLTLRDPAEAAHWAQALGAERLPTGSLRLAGGAPGAVSALPGYDAGAWWVQDAAAALPARLLDARAGERVLDLCAAPGGKTLQLAATGAAVTALDVSGARMTRLRANLARTGLAAQVVVADALDWRPPAPFDAVLLDAPCSASGTIRRHPDMPHARGAAELAALVTLQARLLDRVLDPGAGLLRPGGRVVYCTCSLLPEEGEAQVTAALARHDGVQVEHAAAPEGADPAWRAAGGGWRTRPDHWADRGGLDGFYMARLRSGGSGR